MAETVIIGGGAAGLSAAYYLARGGRSSALVETRPRLGGVICTERVEGCTLEQGPDSFLSAKPAALEWIADLGLSADVIGSNDHLRVTFLRRGGKLIPLPDGLMMMVPTKLAPLLGTRLLSWKTKLRMAAELFHAPGPRGEDESVADFVTRHYGSETVDYLAEPLLSGIYGGNPSLLSVQAVLPRFVELAAKYGSLTRGVLAERAKAAKARPDARPAPLFRSIRGGLGQIVEAAGAAIAGHSQVVRGRAEAVERVGDGFRVRVDGQWMEARNVVVATEAHNAALLLQGEDGRAAELLAAVPYSSSMTVSLGFAAADFEAPPVGFGFLIPRVERRRLIACTWVGTKFPHRTAPGWVVARCFLGGMEDAAVLNEPDETILQSTLAELQEIAGFRAVPRFSRIARWPRSMAQYSVGHPGRQAELAARVAAIPGLYLAGNAYQGIGVPDCVRMGRDAAQRILAR